MGTSDSESKEKNTGLEMELKKNDFDIESLNNSAAYFEQIIKSFPQGIIALDLKGTINFCNEHFLKITGFTKDDIVGKHFTKMPTLRKQDIKFFEEIFDKLIKRRAKKPIEFSWIHKNGSKRSGEAFVNQLKNKNRKTTGLLLYLTDITKRKEAEKRLEESERRYERLVENSPDIAYMFNSEEGAIYWSKSVKDILGFDSEELNRKPFLWIESIHPDDRNAAMNAVKGAEKGNHFDIEYRIKDKNGKWLWFNDKSIYLEGKGKKTRIEGIAREITEIKLAVDELYQEKDRFRTAAEIASDLIYEWDVETDELYWYGDIDSALGYKKGEFPQTINAWLEHIYPDDHPKLEAAVEFHRNSEKPIDIEYRIRRKDGDLLIWKDRGKALFKNGTFKRVIGVCTDITEQKRIENELTRSEEKYRDIVHTSVDWIWEIDEKGKYTFASPKVTELTGYMPDEVLNKTPFDFMPLDEAERIKSVFQRFADQHRPFDRLENRVLHKDGRELILETSGIPIIGESGELLGYRGIDRDITERKSVLESLRLSEERFRTILENLNGGVFAHSLDGKMILVNEAACRNTGYSRSELLQLSVSDLDPLSVGREDKNGIWNQLKKGETRTIQSMHKRKDGSEYPAEIHLNSIEIDGEPVILGVAYDITERVKTEVALKEKEFEFRNLFYVSPISTVYSDLKGNIIQCNNAFCSLHKTKEGPEKQTGRHISEFFPKEEFSTLKKTIDETITTGEFSGPGDCIMLREDGSRFNGSTTCIALMDPDGKPYALLASAIDVTERRAAEEAIRESEEKFRLIFETSPYTIVISNNQGIIVDVNQSFLRQTKYKRDEIIGKSAVEIGLWENADHREEFISEIKIKKYVSNRESTYRIKDGTLRNSIISSKMIRLKDEELLFTMAIDVTEKKKAEEALRENEERFKEIFHNLGMGVAVYEAVGNGEDFVFKEINETGENINRLSRNDTIGKGLLTLFPGVKEMGLFDVLIRVHKTGKPEHYPLELYEDNRLNLWVDNYVFKLPSGDIVAVYNDLTDQKNAEEEKKRILDQLYHAQKMESIGRLAGGIAHDFNNLLVGIMGYAELLNMKHTDSTSIEGEAANVILNSAIRASSLTKQLLGFARKGKFNPEPLNINAIIRNTLKVSEKIFEKNIKTIYDLEVDIKSVEADLHQIEQVLTNLLINAKDAMPNGGTLKLKTRNIIVKGSLKCLCGKAKPGKYVKIEVTDTGIGIPEEIINNIFEPFFTTKGEGKGTGLGLATVYGIITNHDGHLDVESYPGKGTTIIIFLPVSAKKVKAGKKKTHLIKGSGKILIIDDEKNVRQYTGAMLTKMGYDVIYASDGIEAVEIFNERRKEIDLILLDLIMPEKSGKQTLAELQEIDPDIKVILFSGYSQEGIAAEIMENGVRDFIQKPFSSEQLSQAVNKAIKG